jgi:hypothetical protein
MAVPDLSAMVGKTLLVGITYLDSSDAVSEEVQFAGVVTSVDPLVAIDVGKDEPFTLPPEPDAFDVAGPGHYRLRSGETVVDPDFLSTWRVVAPSA